MRSLNEQFNLHHTSSYKFQRTWMDETIRFIVYQDICVTINKKLLYIFCFILLAISEINIYFLVPININTTSY